MRTIVLVLLLLPIFSLCQTTTNLGEIIEGFENLNDWTLDGGSAYDSLNSTNFTEESHSIKLGTYQCEEVSMTKIISMNFNKFQTFSIDLYAPDTIKNILRSLKIKISSTFDSSKSLCADIFAGRRIYMGWNRLVFSKADFTVCNCELWSNKMIRLRITLTILNDGLKIPGYIILDNFRGYVKKSQTVAIITFDDNWRSQKDIGKPILDSLNFKAVEFVVGKTASQSQNNRLHWATFDSLYQDGWDICNHTYTHPYLNNLSKDSLEFEINGMRDTLINHGFLKSCDFFAYPYGNFNIAVINKVKEKHKLSRNSENWQYLPHPTNIGYGRYLLREHNWKLPLTQQYADINKAIDRGQLLIYLFEDIAGYKEKFSAIMHYLKAKQDSGLIKVMTLSKYWNYLNTTTETKKEKSNNNFCILLEQNYPNPFNPCTNIDYTLPKLSQLSIKIYNILGQEIKILFQGIQSPGKHTVTFNASNYPSGTYIYSLETNKFTISKKMLFLK